MTDMLSLAQASALVASSSGFSLWGSFLGSVPRISYPGQAVSRYRTVAFPETEWEPGQSLPKPFLGAVALRAGH